MGTPAADGSAGRRGRHPDRRSGQDGADARFVEAGQSLGLGDDIAVRPRPGPADDRERLVEVVVRALHGVGEHSRDQRQRNGRRFDEDEPGRDEAGRGHPSGRHRAPAVADDPQVGRSSFAARAKATRSVALSRKR